MLIATILTNGSISSPKGDGRMNYLNLNHIHFTTIVYETKNAWNIRVWSENIFLHTTTCFNRNSSIARVPNSRKCQRISLPYMILAQRFGALF